MNEDNLYLIATGILGGSVVMGGLYSLCRRLTAGKIDYDEEARRIMRVMDKDIRTLRNGVLVLSAFVDEFAEGNLEALISSLRSYYEKPPRIMFNPRVNSGLIEALENKYNTLQDLLRES